ncbi:MAG TPA: aldo/keto reductase [Kribbella sp.]|uniref:aldo/keto reductase n=1 Tax=Kribbella sp. TaxID=1871183 RepID=UPI002D77B917|nr:aldo/keto reductase [Kribbella sp.]HET6292004.1 aldo/keto reductase [Kribbella sp.]
MKYVKLGSTGLDVSPIALGCMTYGEPGRGGQPWSLPEDVSRIRIKQAVDAGINFFDTANVYSAGSSEEIVGRALADFTDRDDVVVATKVHGTMRPGHPNGGGLSRKAILTELDNSLTRLGMDYVDLYQIHRLDRSVPLEEILQTLDDVVRAGKVRYIGASSMYAWEFSKALHLQRANGWARFVTMQNHYNLLNREEEREMLPLCADEGIGVIPWSPLARGVLTRDWGVSTDRVAGDQRIEALYGQFGDKEIVDTVGAVAADRGVPRAQVALAWVSQHPTVSAPIIGATKPEHLDDAIASLDLTLTPDEITRLEAPYAPHAVAM